MISPPTASRPKVVFFLPGLNVGGAEWHTVTLQAKLAERGMPSHLLVYGPRRSDVMLKQIEAGSYTLLDNRGMSEPAGWIRAWRALRDLKPDVVVTVNQTPLIVAAALRLVTRTDSTLACIFHTTLLRESEEKRLFLFRWALRLSDMLVYVSANQQSYWSKRGLAPRNQTLILNGIDVNRFAANTDRRIAERARLGLATQDIVFGMVAAFRPEKNHEDLVQALAKVRAKGMAAKLLLVGDGPTRAPVTALADKLGVFEHIVFAGEQSDVRPFIDACDVGVLTSRAVETFSLSALEFLALGVPMIMSRIGGASEIVNHGDNGLLYKAGDLPGLVTAMTAMADPIKRVTMAARARPSLEAFTLDAMVDRYLLLIERLSSQHAA